MAGLYIQAFPPASPLINEYGRDFADFIQGFAPAASVPYLPDVARLERLRVRAYHAKDVCPLDQPTLIDALQRQTALGELCLQLHPCVATLKSTYAVVALWAAHQTGESLATLNPCTPRVPWFYAMACRSRCSPSTAAQWRLSIASTTVGRWKWP